MDFDVLIRHVVEALVILKAKIKSVLLQSFTSDKCGTCCFVTLWSMQSHYHVCHLNLTQVQNIYCISGHAQSFLLISLQVFFAQLPASESTRPMDRWARSASSLAAPAACISGHQTNTPKLVLAKNENNGVARQIPRQTKTQGGHSYQCWETNEERPRVFKADTFTNTFGSPTKKLFGERDLMLGGSVCPSNDTKYHSQCSHTQ